MISFPLFSRRWFFCPQAILIFLKTYPPSLKGSEFMVERKNKDISLSLVTFSPAFFDWLAQSPHVCLPPLGGSLLKQ